MGICCLFRKDFHRSFSFSGLSQTRVSQGLILVGDGTDPSSLKDMKRKILSVSISS